MKYILIIFLFASCSKGANTPPGNNDAAEISYDINAVHYDHVGEQTIANGGIGVFAVKSWGNVVMSTYYSIAAYSSSASFMQILIPTPNDTLKEITYHSAQGIGGYITANHESYSILSADDFFDVTITEYSNAVVSGTFSGKLSKAISINPLILEQAEITNGQINNVQMHY